MGQPLSEAVKKITKPFFDHSGSKSLHSFVWVYSFLTMKRFKQLVCPVSDKRVDENTVRATALLVILGMGGFLLTGNVIFPALLAVDFFIRAFTRLKYSPLSWTGKQFVRSLDLDPVWIDKAPKVFAARIGFLLTALASMAVMFQFTYAAYALGATLVVFAFLECVLNFCAGCWVYTWVVYPLVRKN